MGREPKNSLIKTQGDAKAKKEEQLKERARRIKDDGACECDNRSFAKSKIKALIGSLKAPMKSLGKEMKNVALIHVHFITISSFTRWEALYHHHQYLSPRSTSSSSMSMEERLLHRWIMAPALLVRKNFSQIKRFCLVDTDSMVFVYPYGWRIIIAALSVVSSFMRLMPRCHQMKAWKATMKQLVHQYTLIKFLAKRL